MARYGKAFKDRAVVRLPPPESAPVDVVSQELHISAVTLERWRAAAVPAMAGEAGGAGGAGGAEGAGRIESVLNNPPRPLIPSV